MTTLARTVEVLSGGNSSKYVIRYDAPGCEATLLLSEYASGTRGSWLQVRQKLYDRTAYEQRAAIEAVSADERMSWEELGTVLTVGGNTVQVNTTVVIV